MQQAALFRRETAGGSLVTGSVT
jgi:hypothetical protein